MDIDDDMDNGPLKRPRASLACYRCHNKKVRCDGVHPNCSRCSVAGVLCAYPSSRRSRNTTSLSIDPFIDNLSQFEDRIRKIEAVVQAQKNLIMTLVDEGKIDDADILSRPAIGLEEGFEGAMMKTENDIQDSKAILAQLRLRGEKDALAARRNSGSSGHVDAESEDDSEGEPHARGVKRRMISRWESSGPPMLISPRGTGNWTLSITKSGLRIDTNAPTLNDLYDILLHGINQISMHEMVTKSGGNTKWLESRTPHWLKQRQYVNFSAQKQKEALDRRKKKKALKDAKTLSPANANMLKKAPRTATQRLKVIGSPPRELLDHLVNIFFSCYYPLLPIFDKSSFYSEYTDPEDDDEHGHLILNAMYALTARHACVCHHFINYDKIDVAQKVEIIFHETAKSSLYRIHDKVDIRLVQACLLMAVYQLETQAGTASAYLYSGYASRSAIFLELQKDKSGELDTMTYELNKRVFWSVYLVDFWTSSAAGRPFMIMDVDVKIDLPSPFPVIEEQSEGVQEHEAEILNMQRFVELIKLVRIQKQMGFAKSQATDNLLHDALVEWMGGLPESFRLENEIFATNPSPILAHNILALNIEYNASLLLLKMPELPEIFDEAAFMPNSPLEICSISATTISDYLESLPSIAHCSILAYPIQRALALSSAFHAWNMQYSSLQDIQIARSSLVKNLSTIKRLDGFKCALRAYRHLDSQLERFLNGQGTWNDLLEGSLAVSRNSYRIEFAPSSPPQPNMVHSPMSSNAGSIASSPMHGSSLSPGGSSYPNSRQASPPDFRFPSIERRPSSTSTASGNISTVSSETRKKNERWNLTLTPNGFRMDTNITKVSDLYEILVEGLSQLSVADTTGALAERPNPEVFSRSAAVPATKLTNPRGYENYWRPPSKTDPLIDEQPQELLDQTVVWWLKENQASEVAPRDWFMRQYDELKVEMDPLMINSIYAWGMRQATLNYGMFEDYNANTVGDLYFFRAQAAFEGRMFENTNWKTVVGMFNMGMYAGPMSYIYLGMGMRIMLELGWHRKEFMPPSGDPIEREVCKRIFWLMYIVDTMNEHFYNLPPGLNLADCDIEQAAPFPNSDKESLTKCELMVRYVEMLDILKDIHKAISSSDQILLSDIAQIEHSLTAFYDNLPADWKYPTSTGELLPDYVYVLHTDYHAFWMELHQSFLRQSEDGGAKKLSPSTLVSLHVCLEHSEIVTEMMEIYVEHYGPQNFFQALDGITMATDTYKDVIELSDDPDIVATAVRGISRTIKLLRRTRAYDRQMAVKGLALDLEQWAAKRKLKLDIPKDTGHNGYDDRVPPIPQPYNTSPPTEPSHQSSNSNSRKRAHRQSMGGIQVNSLYGQPATAVLVNTYARDGLKQEEFNGLFGSGEVDYSDGASPIYSAYSNSPNDLNGDVNGLMSGMVGSMPMGMDQGSNLIFDDFSSNMSPPELDGQASNYLQPQQAIFKTMGFNTDQTQARQSSVVYYPPSDDDDFSQTSALDHTLFMTPTSEGSMQFVTVSTPGHHHPLSPPHFSGQQQQFQGMLSEQQLQQQQQQQQQNYFVNPSVASMASGLPSPTPVRSQNFNGSDPTSPTNNQLQFHHFFAGANANGQEAGGGRQQKRWYES